MIHRWRAEAKRARTGASRESGMTLVELMVAMTIFSVMLVGFGMLFGASLKSYRFARARTMAETLGSGEIDKARTVAWSDLGVKNGNPPGLLVAEEDVQVGTSTFHVSRTVELVDDNIPVYGYGTGANYKRVVVKVTSLAMSQPLVYETLVAPPTQPSLFSATIQAHVSETCANTALVGANVSLSGGPSPDRVGTTNSTGDVVFSGLKPTNSSAPGDSYTLTPSMSGWQWLQGPTSDSVISPLDPGQVPSKGFLLYEPLNVTLRLVDKLNQPVTSPYSLAITDLDGTVVTVSGQSDTGTVTLPNFGGRPWVPCKSYMIVPTSLGFTPANPSATPLTNIPGYPGTTDFTVPNALQIPIPARTKVTFTMVDEDTNLPLAGATGTLTTPLEGTKAFTTDAAGQVVFDMLPGDYTINASMASGYFARTWTYTVLVPPDGVQPTPRTSTLAMKPWKYTSVTFTTLDSLTNQPVGGVAVTATGGPLPVSFTTDPVTGTATVSMVQASYTVAVASPPSAYQAYTSPFTVTATTPTMSVSLAPMGAVGGVVKDSTTGAVMGNVAVKFAGGPSGTQTFTSGADGTLSAYLLPGTYTVTVNPAPSGYGTFSATVTVPSGPFSYTVSMVPFGTVPFNVKSWSGTNLQNATIAWSGGPTANGNVKSNSSGNATATLLAGTYNMSISLSGYQTINGTLVVTGGTNATVNYVMYSSTTVSGVKLKGQNSTGGNLSSSAVIKLVGPTTGTSLNSITLPSGGSTWSSPIGLLPGVYTVQVITYPSGHTRVITSTVTITSGTTYNVQFGT